MLINPGAYAATLAGLGRLNAWKGVAVARAQASAK